jgi:hypothetical protein
MPDLFQHSVFGSAKLAMHGCMGYYVTIYSSTTYDNGDFGLCWPMPMASSQPPSLAATAQMHSIVIDALEKKDTRDTGTQGHRDTGTQGRKCCRFVEESDEAIRVSSCEL